MVIEEFVECKVLLLKPVVVIVKSPIAEPKEAMIVN
jgi:hypothetical protein